MDMNDAETRRWPCTRLGASCLVGGGLSAWALFALGPIGDLEGTGLLRLLLTFVLPYLVVPSAALFTWGIALAEGLTRRDGLWGALLATTGASIPW
jgi:hypothetical protein